LCRIWRSRWNTDDEAVGTRRSLRGRSEFLAFQLFDDKIGDLHRLRVQIECNVGGVRIQVGIVMINGLYRPELSLKVTRVAVSSQKSHQNCYVNSAPFINLFTDVYVEVARRRRTDQPTLVLVRGLAYLLVTQPVAFLA
jgi:hypothetical protein